MIIDINNLNEAEIKKLIDNEIEEDLHLEYKSCDSLKKSDKQKNELSKDVSSFSNSDGGTIIYGVIERNHKAAEIDIGYDSNDISKEWIENVVSSKITPKIENIIIKPIKLSKSSEYMYAISIPQSARAPHQASDKKYYKRYNFESVPMEEYEIRELYYRNIISKTEYSKLQARIREDVYKPLYSALNSLIDDFLSEMHPYTIELKGRTSRSHNFSIWNDIIRSGEWMDVDSIGDGDLIEILENLAESISAYIPLTRKYYDEISDFLEEELGDIGNPGYVYWNKIKEEIFQKNPFLQESSETIRCLRNSYNDKWKGMEKLSDVELFQKFYNVLISRFSDAITEIDKLAKTIYEQILESIKLLEVKIKKTYPQKQID